MRCMLPLYHVPNQSPERKRRVKQVTAYVVQWALAFHQADATPARHVSTNGDAARLEIAPRHAAVDLAFAVGCSPLIAR